MKKYLPLVLAVLLLIIIYLLSFGAAKKARLKKLRAADDPAPQTSQTEDTSADDTTAAPDESTSEVDTSPTINVTGLTALPVPNVINMPTDSSWSIVLINVFYQMNETYEPMVDQVAEGIVLEERVAEAYKAMAAAAAKDGITLTLASGYVSPDRQERLYQKEVDSLVTAGMTVENARLQAAYTVLPPRCSEANYGLSVDFDQTGGDFASTAAYVWLRAHAAEYGFVERYTADKESFTHFKACPWHWRYVGVDASKYMRDYNVSLEEYVGQKD